MIDQDQEFVDTKHVLVKHDFTDMLEPGKCSGDFWEGFWVGIAFELLIVFLAVMCLPTQGQTVQQMFAPPPVADTKEIKFPISTPYKLSAEKSHLEGRIGARINMHGVVNLVRYRSPAQLAGLQVGDVIQTVDARTFQLNRLNGHAGDQFLLGVYRGQKTLFIQVEMVPVSDIDYKTDPDADQIVEIEREPA